jgi:hypothetical protein
MHTLVQQSTELFGTFQNNNILGSGLFGSDSGSQPSRSGAYHRYIYIT